MSHPYPYGYEVPSHPSSSEQAQQHVPPQPRPLQHPHPQQYHRPNLTRLDSDQSNTSAGHSPTEMSMGQFVTPNPVDRQYTPYPPGMYYSEASSSAQSYHLTTPAPNIQFYPPSIASQETITQERARPPMSIDLSSTTPFASPLPPAAQMPVGYFPVQEIASQTLLPVSPYGASMGVPSSLTPGSGNSVHGMTEYFPPFGVSPAPGTQPLPSFNQTWSSTAPSGPKPKATTKAGKPANGAKTSRQQFTACGACRHRRVKCDLKDRQDQAERDAHESGGTEPRRNAAGSSSKRKKVACTNCEERGTNCIDEYAPIKIAKQLRRGKRISEIEMLYGKSAASAAASNADESSSDASKSPGKPNIKEEFVLPELSKAFFESAFFRRFQIQRPIIDPTEFVNRYLSFSPPYAAALGPEGAILCHVLYAWAVSYGVDEHGRLDVPEGGDAPDEHVDLSKHSAGELKREQDRQRRKDTMRGVLEYILRRIDECGVMRKPSWDGVRALLMILPLTEGISSPVERLAMYEAAISQVFTLCSHIGMGYDGRPSATSSANGGVDQTGTIDTNLVRVRIYWYAFVHEGITTGLKGGRLHLDDEDLETMQDSIDNRAMVFKSSPIRSAAKFATAPINLALACRLINKALTGPAAKRRQNLDPNLVKNAWEALESCWEEFDSLRGQSPAQAYSTSDEIVRFSDGWKIFLFEAQNVIRKSLEERLVKSTSSSHGNSSGAYIVDQQIDVSPDVVTLRHLLDIAKSKCEVMTRQILEIVRTHVGTRFFEWDASLVRDGTYYAAMLHAKAGGSDEDIAMCIQALNELRWAHAKAWERSADLRKEWAASRPIRPLQGWDPAQAEFQPAGYYPNFPVDGTSTISGSGSPYTSPGTVSVVDTAITAGPTILSQSLYVHSSQGASLPLPPTEYALYAPNTGPPPLDVMIHSVPPPLAGQGHSMYLPLPGRAPPPPQAGHYMLQPDGSQVYVPY